MALERKQLYQQYVRSFATQAEKRNKSDKKTHRQRQTDR